MADPSLPLARPPSPDRRRLPRRRDLPPPSPSEPWSVARSAAERLPRSSPSFLAAGRTPYPPGNGSSESSSRSLSPRAVSSAPTSDATSPGRASEPERPPRPRPRPPRRPRRRRRGASVESSSARSGRSADAAGRSPSQSSSGLVGRIAGPTRSSRRGSSSRRSRMPPSIRSPSCGLRPRPPRRPRLRRERRSPVPWSPSSVPRDSPERSSTADSMLRSPPRSGPAPESTTRGTRWSRSSSSRREPSNTPVANPPSSARRGRSWRRSPSPRAGRGPGLIPSRSSRRRSRSEPAEGGGARRVASAAASSASRRAGGRSLPDSARGGRGLSPSAGRGGGADGRASGSRPRDDARSSHPPPEFDSRGRSTFGDFARGGVGRDGTGVAGRSWPPSALAGSVGSMPSSSASDAQGSAGAGRPCPGCSWSDMMRVSGLEKVWRERCPGRIPEIAARGERVPTCRRLRDLPKGDAGGGRPHRHSRSLPDRADHAAVVGDLEERPVRARQSTTRPARRREHDVDADVPRIG